MTNARHEVQANANLIDPGTYKFVNSLPASSGILVSSVTCEPVSTAIPPLSSTALPVTALSSASSASSPVIIPPPLPAETSDAEIQVDTASLIKDCFISSSKEELLNFIVNINQEISQLEKVRELAVVRLNSEKELLEERELRRKLESENRKLRRELERLKEERSESENYFSRDERFEMYERPDGRLNCFRRDSTSLSERLGKKVKPSSYQIFTEE